MAQVQGWEPGPAPTSAWTPGPAPAATPDFKTTNATDAQGQPEVDPNTLGTFVTHLWSGINPVQIGQMLPFPKALGGSGKDNPLFPTNIAQSLHQVKKEADTALAKGDYVGALAKYVESVVPILGPMMAHQGNELQQGKYAAAGGDMAALAASVAAPKMLEGVARASAGPILKNPDPAAAAAVKAGQAEGVPVDVATASGNRFVRGVQKLADESLGGSMVAQKAVQGQQAAMGQWADKLANTTRETAATPETAGQAIRDALTSKLQAHSDLADHAYEQLRTLEQQPGRATTVDMRPVKAALQPIFDQLNRQMPITQKQASRGFTALQNVINGPDLAPLSQADQDLGAIKELARNNGGVSKLVVSQMDSAVRAAAAKAGPDVSRALQMGRNATIAKYGTQDLIDALPGGKLEEPVAIFQRATANRDAGIEFLRAVQKQTPQALPGIARAKLEELMGMGPDKAATEWGKVGQQTRSVLFPQAGQAQALDHFFLLAKKLAENPNPSGTALTVWKGGELIGLTSNPAYGVPYSISMTGLSKLLHSPAATRALTTAMSVSLANASTAAKVAALSALLRAAREANVPVTTAGVAQGAEGQQP